MSEEKPNAINIFAEIIKNMPSIILVVSEDGEVLHLSNLAEELLNKKNANAVGAGLPAKDIEIPAEIISIATKGKVRQCNVIIDDKTYQFSCTKMEWMDGYERIVASGTDITELKNAEKKLILRSNTDSMTGILNRESLLSYFEKCIEDVKAGSPGFSICYVSINDLRLINETYGRPAGDKYVLTIVAIIKNSIRKTDIFGRMEGNEFLIILPGCKYDKIQSAMTGVCARLEEINLSGGLYHKYSISYGISEIDRNSNLDPDSILNVIDTKMHYMKEEYKKRHLKIRRIH